MADYFVWLASNKRYAYRAGEFDPVNDVWYYELPTIPRHDDFVSLDNLDASQNPIVLRAQHPHLVESMYTPTTADATILAAGLQNITYRFDAYAYNGVWRVQSSHTPFRYIEAYEWSIARMGIKHRATVDFAGWCGRCQFGFAARINDPDGN